MKKGIIAVGVMALAMLIATNARAYNRKYVQDLADNGSNYVDMTCPAGTKLVGFAYFDLENDAADAASVVCEGAGGETTIPKTSDWPSTTKEVQEHKCNKDEKVWGVSYKDRSGKDAMDGLRVICKNKKTGAIRYSYNPDTQGGPAWVNIFTSGGEIVGLSYKDGGGGGTHTDYCDGVTILTK